MLYYAIKEDSQAKKKVTKETIICGYYNVWTVSPQFHSGWKVDRLCHVRKVEGADLGHKREQRLRSLLLENRRLTFILYNLYTERKGRINN